MPHTVLSLDLGSNVGWCIGRDSQIRASGIKTLGRGPKAHKGARFLEFRNWLPKWKGIDEIFFEQIPRFESTGAALVYGGLRADLLVFGLCSGIQISGMYAPTIKKIFTGNGRADKLAMCKHAHALGWTGGEKGTAIDNDEADACAVYFSIMQRRGIDVTFAKDSIPS